MQMDHNDYPQMQHAADCADPGTADADPGTADAETIVISDRGHELMRPEPSVELPRLSPTERLQGESLKHVIESYLRYYAAGEGHTARAKQYDLQYFLQFLAGARQPEAVTVADWTLQATKDFVDARLAAGEAPATVSRRLATIKHFGRTVAERVHGFINPAREVKNPVLHPNRPQGLSSEEIELLREAGRAELSRRKSSFLALRDRFLLELLLSTGLRADEVRLLLCSQLSNDLRWLRNVKTKGRKFRNVYLDGDIRELFQQYLASREAELEKRFSDYTALPSKERQRFPVLVSVHGAVLSSPASFGLAPKTIWRIIAAFGRKAQENAGSTLGNLHPHKLRHTFAHGLLDTSKDVRLVAQALGHSDVRTTMRYTERTDEQVAEAIEQKLRQARRKQSGTG